MSDPLTDRLNKILPRLVADDFLGGSGIGNEISFYVFDYPPEHELRVREHIRSLLDSIAKKKPGLRVKHVNLFDFLLNLLEAEGYLVECLHIQRENGDGALLDALEGLLDVKESLLPQFETVAQPDHNDLVLVSGVGSVYPLLRTSGLLSNLQTVMGQTPLVIFYPGRYDQMTLKLFGKLGLSASFEGAGKTRKSEHYYRAFRLVP
jgi:hypothetical protein